MQSPVNERHGYNTTLPDILPKSSYLNRVNDEVMVDKSMILGRHVTAIDDHDNDD